jgi:hypothetical protein
VGVIEAKAGWFRHEGDAAHAMRRNVWRSLLGGAINISRNELAMPVQLFGRLGVVVDIDDDPLTFRKPHQRSRKLAVVKRR